LTASNAEFESINYLEKPLSASDLRQLLRAAGLKPAEVLRTKEAAHKQYVAGKDLSDDQLFRVIAEHPELLQRPIVVSGKKAVLARPVENLAKLGIK